MFLSCYVTHFFLALAVIIFLRHNSPRIWCNTSQAPPVRRERESPHLVPPPTPLYWSCYVRLSPWLQMIFYFSLRSFISSCKTDPFSFIAYNWAPPVGGLEQKTKLYSEANQKWSDLISVTFHIKGILNVLTSLLIFNNRHTEEHLWNNKFYLKYLCCGRYANARKIILTVRSMDSFDTVDLHLQINGTESWCSFVCFVLSGTIHIGWKW
jgi:hypothetical protein